MHDLLNNAITNPYSNHYDNWERDREEYEKVRRDREREYMMKMMEAKQDDYYQRLLQLTEAVSVKKELTYEDKMNMKKFTLNDIISLTDALSLSISDPEERASFDTIVRNWRDDKLKEIR